MVDTLYVAFNDWIDAYDIVGGGAPSRSRRIHGPSTLLNVPVSMAVDASGTLYVGNENSGMVTVYEASADGDVAPLRTIDTGFPGGLAIDSAGYLYVLDAFGNNNSARHVTVYAPGASGNATPVRTLTGIRVGDAGGPNLESIAIDFFDNLYVSGQPPGFVDVYAAGAQGAAPPVRTITGALSTATGMDFDTFNNLYLADGINVLVFGPTATGPVAPLRTLGGSVTGISDDFVLAVDASNVLYVGSFSGEDRTQGRVNVFPAAASGNVPPSSVIAGFDPAAGVPIALAMRKPRIFTPSPIDRSKLWELVATLYGAIPVDGWGLVFIGPVPVPIGPWGPLVESPAALRDVLVGLGIASLASSIAEPGGRTNVRRAALETARAGIEQLLTNVR